LTHAIDFTKPDDGILDAEIIDFSPRPKRADVVPVRELVVTAIRPAVDAAPGVAKRVGLFLLLALTVDLGRGLLAFVRSWWRWKTLATSTERATAEGKFAVGEDKRQERRDRRTIQSVIGIVVLAIAGLLFWWLAPAEYKMAAGVVTVLGLFAAGHEWRRPVGPPTSSRPPGWNGTEESLLRALRAAKVLTKDQHVWMQSAKSAGVGTEIIADLDGGITPGQIRAKLSPLASGLGVDSEFMTVEKGQHDGQVKLWITEVDPFKSGPERCPLLDADRWDAWDEAPFGRTARGVEVLLKLMYSNYLGGGMPGSGKSFTARVVAAPFILDPDVRMFCANGKGDGAWEAIKDICVDYIRGAREDDGWHLVAMLDKVIVEMYDRYDYTTANGLSKIRPEHGRPPWAVIIDELQQYTGLSEITDQTIWGKKNATLGMVIAYKLTELAKLARASGIILVMLTQKPSDKSLPLELRDQISTRFSNRVSNRHVSEMILGKSTSDGVDASTLSQKHKGIGILVPDMEEAPFDGYPTVRPYLITDAEWEELGRKGKALRREAGTEGWSRGSEADAYPLPELLEAIVELVDDMRDDQRPASRVLREELAPEMTATAFGLQLKKWGCPTGRDNGKQAMGPLVGDIRKAAQRIREGGRVEVLNAA
jgi:S-DNA-T family DNA segregation ATPase FtsK/SpoIIIE